MFDLEEEVLHHIARQIDAPALEQAQNDEVAVPSIHLVEAAAGDHVRMREIEQALRRQVDTLTEPSDLRWKPLDIESAFLPESSDLGRLRKILRQIEDRPGGDLGIDQGCAVQHRASERVPCILDVGVDGWRGCGGQCRRLRLRWRSRLGWLRKRTDPAQRDDRNQDDRASESPGKATHKRTDSRIRLHSSRQHDIREASVRVADRAAPRDAAQGGRGYEQSIAQESLHDFDTDECGELRDARLLLYGRTGSGAGTGYGGG